MDIGSRIREIRSALNISITSLSRDVGISNVYLSDIERGKKVPTIQTLEKICTALNINMGQFFGEGEDPVALTPELKDLLDTASQLPPEKVNLVNTFLQQIALGHKPKVVKTQVDDEEYQYSYNEDERPAPTKDEEIENKEILNKIYDKLKDMTPEEIEKLEKDLEVKITLKNDK